MSFVVCDFETYYDKDYSLSKMTTEEYIRDPRFEVIGVGVKVDDNPPEWFSGTHEETKAFLDKIDWANSAVLCHNTMFDGGILSFAFDIIPAYYFDTLSMARALHGTEVSGSLKAMAQYYEIGEKGTEVINALGRRRKDFSPAELAAYGSYCLNDVELTYKLLQAMGAFPSKEYDLIDMTLRMYTQPVFRINDALLVDRLKEIKHEKSELLRGLMGVLDVGTEEEVRKKLASSPQFAALLMDMGVNPPVKISPTTNKETYAFAKNDEGFIELTEHENPIVQQLCAVRLGTKSTIEESRVERFIGIGARNKGLLPIPLKYYGAHTGRWSGSDSVNLQNLPSRDKRKKAIKNSIMAPPGYVVINSDSSQIEARVLAWLSGQNDLVRKFANGDDVYCAFASEVYRRPITEKDVVERFVGKTCILGLGYGTGAKKLRHTLKTQPPGADLSDMDCEQLVRLYRSVNDRIPQFWQDCDGVLSSIMNGQRAGHFGTNNVLLSDTDSILLPNGMRIRYPNLRKSEGKFIYDSRHGVRSIWGGAVTENVVQALARIIIGEQMLAVSATYRPALTVHDALTIVVPKEEAEQAVEFVGGIMRKPPEWAPGLPVACKVTVGETYGDC